MSEKPAGPDAGSGGPPQPLAQQQSGSAAAGAPPATPDRLARYRKYAPSLINMQFNLACSVVWKQELHS